MRKFRLSSLNLSKVLCNHLIGERHTKLHRKLFGVGIMILGVGVTKAVYVVDLGAIHFLGDVLGYGIHGIGAIPWVESLTEAIAESSEG